MKAQRGILRLGPWAWERQRQQTGGGWDVCATKRGALERGWTLGRHVLVHELGGYFL